MDGRHKSRSHPYMSSHRSSDLLRRRQIIRFNVGIFLLKKSESFSQQGRLSLLAINFAPKFTGDCRHSFTFQLCSPLKLNQLRGFQHVNLPGTDEVFIAGGLTFCSEYTQSPCQVPNVTAATIQGHQDHSADKDGLSQDYKQLLLLICKIYLQKVKQVDGKTVARPTNLGPGSRSASQPVSQPLFQTVSNSHCIGRDKRHKQKKPVGQCTVHECFHI